MIIGICGYAGCGKTTISSHLMSEHGFVRRKFAAPLKDMVRSLLRSQGVSHVRIERMIEGDMKESPSPYFNGATPRHVMQTLGTDWGRALISEDLWCDAATRELGLGLERVVYDDVRYVNEADAIRAAGGYIVRLHREGVGPVNNHTSEKPPWADLDVANNDSVNKTMSTILRAIENLPR